MAEQNFPAICFSSQLETTVGESLEIQRKEICILYYWWCPCSTKKKENSRANGEIGIFCRELYGKEQGGIKAKKKKKKETSYVTRKGLHFYVNWYGFSWYVHVLCITEQSRIPKACSIQILDCNVNTFSVDCLECWSVSLPTDLLQCFILLQHKNKSKNILQTKSRMLTTSKKNFLYV